MQLSQDQDLAFSEIACKLVAAHLAPYPMGPSDEQRAVFTITVRRDLETIFPLMIMAMAHVEDPEAYPFERVERVARCARVIQ